LSIFPATTIRQKTSRSPRRHRKHQLKKTMIMMKANCRPLKFRSKKNAGKVQESEAGKFRRLRRKKLKQLR